MMEDQYTPRTYKQEYDNAKCRLERLNDFIEYLFEHSEHCDHITQTEAWAEFEKWEHKQNIKEAIGIKK